MERLYPHLDYTELTTCGHFIHMEQPEMFNDKLKAFIASQMPNKQQHDFKSDIGACNERQSTEVDPRTTNDDVSDGDGHARHQHRSRFLLGKT